VIKKDDEESFCLDFCMSLTLLLFDCRSVSVFEDDILCLEAGYEAMLDSFSNYTLLFDDTFYVLV
jgi:hypothetical protein